VNTVTPGIIPYWGSAETQPAISSFGSTRDLWSASLSSLLMLNVL